MARITVNPEAEANVAFDVVKPAVYRMRVKETSEFDAQSGSHCLRVRLEYVDPSACEKNDGTGIAKNPGTLLDSSLVLEPKDKQGKLRGFVEACGIAWSDFDTDDLVGKEVDVKVKTEEYQGELKNAVARYLAVK